ncbi:hypothetical protein BBO99_00003714 [Phytophthora kernoviae]|uniref:Protein disulfide-isomerase n=2 Tax=Phytophthora kernoviae TaxID=325452 RepID=A0A3R7FXU3_9STRA|nr:hypothetical protein G195_009377 [Phytophthora kernoviae 00238/432]KAG2523860.1 hypothetical protein JM16_003219 [Phytophthora kernoviae]KAG2525688.1 hypothetical protein JM18_003089 [Phytophthora kernoviae]RLN02584.1 hypothetical protein BBI17_003438 [Phytophthora kernoviae]RLN81440.1 hypothetical protein BBO99_00003714 [Phytophthora kernoviae]
MRRMSTAVAAPARSRLRNLFQQQPLEDIPELKSILAVQTLVTKVRDHPAPRQLKEKGAYHQWIETYRSRNNYNSQTQLGREAFDAFMKEAGVYLQKQEEEAFQGCEKIGAMDESELRSPQAEAFVEAVKLKLSRHICMQAAGSFDYLDKDKDGKIQLCDVEKLLLVAAQGNGTEWLKSQFHVYDADGDGVITETESKLILDAMIDTQKTVMKEIFATHVENLPKKHEKLFAKSLSEEDYKSKIPEKVRCIFHFANKLDEERKTYDWELFEDSQKAEFPELHNLLAVYTKGFYDERFTFFERKQEKRAKLEAVATCPTHTNVLFPVPVTRKKARRKKMMFMKQAARALALLFAVALVVRAAEFEEEDDVLVLTEANFAEAVSGHDTLLVEFYAPWCGHCKKLTPEYALAAKNLKELDPPIRLAKIDATAETKLAEQFAVRGFPTLKFFKGDVDAVKDYDGGRTASDIEKWVVKKSGPAVKIVETAEELEEIKKVNDVVVFTVVDAEEGEARTLLEKLADADDLAVYVASTSTDLTEDVAAVNKVVLYKKFDEGKVVYDGEFEKEALGDFVKGNSLPLVITFTQDKAPMIFGGDMAEHVLAFVDTDKDYVAGIEKALKTPARENKGKLLHVIMPHTEKRIVDYFGLAEADMPAIMLVNMGGSMKKYGFDYKGDDFIAKIDGSLAEDLVAFEKRYFGGELTPELKSAEPEDDSDEAVKVIVGKEFQERVVNNEKDVLLEFYAPWCGHCKSLAPKYEELAEKFADVDTILIGKMDATANEVDHPGVDVRGFPTLLFFPGKDKQNPVVYEGSRDVEGFTEFLKNNAQKFELDGAEHGAKQEAEEEDGDDQEDEAADEKTDAAEHEEL